MVNPWFQATRTKTMACPDGWSPLSTTNSTTQEFAQPSALNRQASISSHQSSSQKTIPPRVPFTSNPSQTSFETKLGQQSQTLPFNISQLYSRRNRQDLHQQTSDLLQDLTTDYIPYTNIRHESKVSSRGPWNPYELTTTPMRIPSDNVLLDIQQAKKRPDKDSGYASSQRSHPRLNNNISPTNIFEASNHHTYDEPIGSAAQQNIYLPDQQRQQPSVFLRGPPSSIAPSVIAESISPNTQSSRCQECPEVFNTKSEMSKHMARHNKKFTCDHPNCARAADGFATKNDLDRHKGSVHHDATVARKEFKCSVVGCKDPGKTWDRKDNFKAHVKRMHPEVDADEVVTQSFRGENIPPTEAPLSSAASHGGDFVPTNFAQTSSNLLFSPNTAIDTSYIGTSHYPVDQGAWPGEGDLYDASNSSALRQIPYQQQLDIAPYQGQHYLQNPNYVPSATIGQSYASSTTVAGTTNQAESMPPLLAHRQNLTPLMFAGNFPNSNYMRPADAHTAPVVGHAGDDFQSNAPDWNHNFDAASVMEHNITPIDPDLQTLQSGSWQPPSSSNAYPQQADILNQSLQSNVQITTDEQSPTGPAIAQRREQVWKQLNAIMKHLPPEEVKIMVEAYQKHPVTPNKHTCAVRSALDARQKADERSFPCTRQGCSKTFSQKNIRTKHEKRHDRLFFCTFDHCYSTFGSKDDLRRHERRKHEREVFEGWRCFVDDVPTSQHRPDCSKFFLDEDAFKQHRRDEHKERAVINNGGLKAMKSCRVKQGMPGQFWCGFCNKVIPNDLGGTDGTKPDKFRYDHIDQHITRERKTMADWVDLKSAGRTKVEIQAGDDTQAGQQTFDDSENDEERDETSPEVSTTPLTPSLQVTAPSSQTMGEDSSNSRPRKRARSVADHETSASVVKAQRVLYQQTPRQAPTTLRGVSGATARSTFLGLGVQRRPQAVQIVAVTCCRCTTRRSYAHGPACIAPNCSHRWCPNCEFVDASGNRRSAQPPQPNSGQGGNAV